MVVVQTPIMLTRITGVFHREIEVALKRQSEMGELNGRAALPLAGEAGGLRMLSALSSTHVLTLKLSPRRGEARRVIQEDGSGAPR